MLSSLKDRSAPAPDFRPPRNWVLVQTFPAGSVETQSSAMNRSRNSMSPLTSAFIQSWKRFNNSCSAVPVFVWAGGCDRAPTANAKTARQIALVRCFTFPPCYSKNSPCSITSPHLPATFPPQVGDVGRNLRLQIPRRKRQAESSIVCHLSESGGEVP